MVHNSGSIIRRHSACVALLVASWFSQGTGLAQAPLTIMFDTSALSTATGSGPLAFNSGTAPLTADNVYVYFEQAGPMSVVVGGTALTYSSGTWVYGSGTYTGGMSPGFSVSTINNSGGIQATSINGNNMFIAYGANTFGDQPTPSFSTATRFAVIEPNYSSTSGGAIDLTNIDQFSAALSLSWSDTTSTVRVSSTKYTNELLPLVVATQGGTGAFGTGSLNILSAASQSGTPANNAGGQYVTRVLGADQTLGYGGTYPGWITDYTQYVSGVLSGTVETVKSPQMCNLYGSTLYGPGAMGSMSGTAPATAGISGSTNYLASYFFTPTFNLVGGTSYAITFSGSVNIVAPASNTPIVTYGGTTNGLQIQVPASEFLDYLIAGNVSGNVTSVILSGSDWSTFATDFYNGSSQTAAGSQSAPSPAIAAGGTGINSAPYGQVAQRVLGDMQELMMVGIFGNTGTNASGQTLGAVSSGTFFNENIAYAYANTGTAGFNPMGKVIWFNSEMVSASGTVPYGGVYANPYDDRFGKNLLRTGTGGVLTIGLMEVAPVPEPSGVALLTVMGATASGIAWRRRQRKPQAGARVT
jgi:hypothetical protein